MHGGNIYEKENRINLDFSVNTNPLGIPKFLAEAFRHAGEWAGRYPDLEVDALRKALADTKGCDASQILCGNGASELIMLYCQALQPKKALMPVPTFTGYAHGLQTVDTVIEEYLLNKEQGYLLDAGFVQCLNQTDADLVILCRPNNPTGRLIPKELLEEVMQVTRERQIALLVDECFLDFTKEHQDSLVARLEDFPNLAVLQAFTKNYCLPGVRLGMLYTANMELLRQMKRRRPEWNVSTIAQELGLLICKEAEGLALTRELVRIEKRYLTEHLSGLGFIVTESEANFIHFQGPAGLEQKLEQQGILIRQLGDLAGMTERDYRIAVRTQVENRQLLDALQKVIN